LNLSKGWGSRIGSVHPYGYIIKERLTMLADDIISHYEERQYVLTGKAMIVCMTRRIAINLYKTLLEKYNIPIRVDTFNS
jgi:type I site-specific restriction-modification system R (restriction) subunit